MNPHSQPPTLVLNDRIWVKLRTLQEISYPKLSKAAVAILLIDQAHDALISDMASMVQSSKA